MYYIVLALLLPLAGYRREQLLRGQPCPVEADEELGLLHMVRVRSDAAGVDGAYDRLGGCMGVLAQRDVQVLAPHPTDLFAAEAIGQCVIIAV